MNNLILKLARLLAIIGGVLLTLLALMMTLSIIGGSIAKIGYAKWFGELAPTMAIWIQETGIRTIPGMYEMMILGIAFVIFSFLPIAQITRGHAVVDIFTDFLPARLQQFIISFWETLFLVALLLITWRLWFGMERLMSSGMTYQDLPIPQWWGYAAAFVQMLFTSLVAAYTCWAQWVKFLTGRDLLPENSGAAH